jgi:hypothetical protein
MGSEALTSGELVLVEEMLLEISVVSGFDLVDVVTVLDVVEFTRDSAKRRNKSFKCCGIILVLIKQ